MISPSTLIIILAILFIGFVILLGLLLKELIKKHKLIKNHKKMEEENCNRPECINKDCDECFIIASKNWNMANTEDKYVCCGLTPTPEEIKRCSMIEPYNPKSNKGGKIHELCGWQCEAIENHNYVKSPLNQEERDHFYKVVGMVGNWLTLDKKVAHEMYAEFKELGYTIKNKYDR